MVDSPDVLAVRVARPEDAPAIAAIQVKAMTQTVAAALGDKAAARTLRSDLTQEVARTWHATITQPPSSHRGVLVARENDDVVGFAAFAGAQDLDAKVQDEPAIPGLPFDVPRACAQILAFEVSPAHRRLGHGSRLLAGIADTAGATAIPGLVTWIIPEDEGRVRFFQQAGFTPVGVRRNLDTGAGSLIEHLWFSALV